MVAHVVKCARERVPVIAGAGCMSGPCSTRPPVNTAPPVVSGDAVRSSLLSATQGTWDGDGNAYSYQWQRSSTGSARHAAIGTDLDGGYGTEQSPGDLDTIADLQKIPPLLRDRGYAEADVEAIMRGNWLRLIERAWS